MSEWYKPVEPINTTIGGLFGLAANKWILLGDDFSSGEIWRFDMCEEIGIPYSVPVTPNHKLGICDAVYLPPKYHSTVLLVTDDATSSKSVAEISVFRSKDGK